MTRSSTSPKTDGNVEAMARKTAPKKKSALFYCGFISGMVQAVIFNPWDRALYLSVTENRDFLNKENFKRPFSGLAQTLFQRTVTAGIYFPLEDIFFQFLLDQREKSQSDIHNRWIALAAGNLAGAVSGLFLNPLAAVKYHTWGLTRSDRQNFFRTSQNMFHHGGLKPFVTGTFATVARDTTFGGCFSVIRHGLHSNTSNEERIKEHKFFIDMIAAIFATVVSSPLNYVRNMHYATHPADELKSTRQILGDLWRASQAWCTVSNRMLFLQHQLRVGWGTLRMGCGMAVGGKIYGMAVTMLASDSTT